LLEDPARMRDDHGGGMAAAARHGNPPRRSEGLLRRRSVDVAGQSYTKRYLDEPVSCFKLPARSCSRRRPLRFGTLKLTSYARGPKPSGSQVSMIPARRTPNSEVPTNGVVLPCETRQPCERSNGQWGSNPVSPRRRGGRIQRMVVEGRTCRALTRAVATCQK
jgi:hypothetical protein